MRDAAKLSGREIKLLLTLEQLVRSAQFPGDRRFREIHAVLDALTEGRKR